MPQTATQPTEATPNARREGRPAPVRLRFRGDIEGLRGIAIGLGVLGHLYHDGGGSISHFVPAMDIFFAMSGFLITSLLVAEYERNSAPKGKSRKRRPGTISLRDFYERRALRILPAGLVTIAVTLLISKLAFNTLRFSEVQADALWATFWTENFNLISKSTDYFAIGAVESPFQHYWSLAVEEQFYLFWPAVFLLATKLKFLRNRSLMAGGRWPHRVVAVATAIAIPSFVICVITSFDNPQAAYFSTINRVWILLLGAIAATVPVLRGGLPDREARIACWAGAGLIGLALLITGSGVPYPGIVGILPAVGTVLILLSGVREDAPRTQVTRVLESRPVRFTGRISYSLYLWHWPIIVFAAALVPRSDLSGVPRGIALGVLSMVVAWLSFRFVETPFMMVKRTYRSGRNAKGVWVGNARTEMHLATLGIVAILSIGTIAAFARPASTASVAADARLERLATWDGSQNQKAHQLDLAIPRRWTQSIEQGLAQTVASPKELDYAFQRKPVKPDPECFTPGDNRAAIDRCTVSGQNRSAKPWPETMPKTLVLIGWSLAAQFGDTIAEVVPPDVKVIRMTRVACAPELRTPDACGNHNRFVDRELKRLEPGMIVFGSALDKNSSTLRLGRFIKDLKPHARTIVWLGPYPRMPLFEDCITGGNRISACKTPMKDMPPARVTDFQSRSLAKETGVTLLPLAGILCSLPKNECPPFVNGAPLFHDGRHMTVQALRQLRGFVAKAIEEAVSGAR